MTRIEFIFATISVIHVSAAAQTTGTYSRTDSSGSRFPGSGKITIDLEPVRDHSSLDPLVRFSPVILEGTVVSHLRSFFREPDLPYLVETHSIISVERVLKGEIPLRTPTILLAQTGGRVGDLELVVRQAPIVVPGERYFLFLVPDDRNLPVDNSGMARYVVEGIWSGSIKIDSGNNARLSPAALEPLRSSLGGLTKEQLRAKIEATIKGKDILGDKNLPIHPGPPRVQR